MLSRSLPRLGQPLPSTFPNFATSRATTGLRRPFHHINYSASAVVPPNEQSSQAGPSYHPTQSARSAHAISNPTLAGIEKRWEDMPPQEQAELWMQLRDRMKVDWHEMTLQEKKIAWWVAFGPHGPRAQTPPGEWGRVLLYSGYGVIISAVLFFIIHGFARPPPRTMTKEWQEATNEYLKKEKSNPIFGISSEGYKGKGHVQSKSEKRGGS